MSVGHILVGVLAAVFVHPVVGVPMFAVETFRRNHMEEGDPWR